MFKVMDLVNFLKSNTPYKFYPNEFPSQETSDCATVLFNAGGTLNKNIGTPSFQILVHSKHPADAETMAYAIFEFLNEKTNFLVGTTHFVRCASTSAVPLYTGQMNEWYVYSLNFNTIISQ
jgi:hypothetical protein